MKISIVIVTYNSAETISSCLESVFKYRNLVDEFIVVDNASRDKTVEKVKKFNSVKLIENKKNLGFAAANNIGIKQSKSPYVFLLNPDAIVIKGLDLLIEQIERDNKIGIIGPKLVNADGSLQKEMTYFPGLFNQILILLRLHRLPWIGSLVYPNYDYNKPQEADHLMGSALLIRREVFEKVGLFDENFFVWFEETDLEKRAKAAGFKIVYYPKTVVSHKVGESTSQLNFFKRQTIWNQSLLYYFKKNCGIKWLLLIPFTLFSFIPAALFSLKKVILSYFIVK